MTPQMITTLCAGPFLGQLSPDVRKCLLKKAWPRSYERGATICLQGEKARSLKIVLDGWVKLFRVSRSGHETVLSTLSTSGSFDEAAALQSGTCQASVEAVSACTILHVDLAAICSCPDAREEVQAAVVQASSLHLEMLMEQIQQLRGQSGTERLSKFLMGMDSTENGRVVVQLPFEKSTLAGILGMKPESLSRAFSRLKGVGVSSESRSITIRDMSTLRAYAQSGAM